MSGETLIGIDIGTTCVKGVMVDARGHVLAEYSQTHATTRPAPGQAEQDPDAWMRLVDSALETLCAEAGPGTLLGIGLTSQVNTHVFTGADLTPLRPAIIWQDTRAGTEGAALDKTVSDTEKLSWFGAPMPIDASHALARMAWVARHEPDIWARTAHVLSPKDYCAARLTGRVAADPISSVGLVSGDLTYVEPLIARIDGARARFPDLADPLEIAGVISEGRHCAGTPVTLGTMDAWAGMFGTGVAQNHQAFYLSGTSEVLGVLSAERKPTPGVIVFPPWQGITLHAGPTQSGGAALDWLGRLLNRTPGELGALVENTQINRHSPLFLPHLAGERAPVWDAGARGAFAGLDMASDPAALVLAVMEGVAFSARMVLDTLEESARMRPAGIHAGGGGMRLARWCQIRADALGRPLHRMAAGQSAAIGAAICAGAASGRFGSLAQTATSLAATRDTFTPDPAGSALADSRYRTFKLLYQQLKPVNARLV